MEEFKFLNPKKMPHPKTGMTLEYLDKHSAIATLILSSDEKKGYFVKQFRPGLKKEVLEVVAGLIDPGEDPIESLYREAREEAGFEKSDFEMIYEGKEPLAISPGYTSEMMSVYILKIKKDAKQLELRLDEGEVLSGEWVELSKILDMTNDFKTHFLVRMYELISLKNK